MARRPRHPGRPAGAVLRPAAAGPGGDGRRGRPTTSGRVLRRNGFHVREATEADGTRYLYGDRHQYTKMATLLTHLGLILFLRRGRGHVAGSATSRAWSSREGEIADGPADRDARPPARVKNLGFEAPGFDTGTPTDFTTDLAVFQDGQQIARKTIRVNDPLSVAGYTFHQNGFGPAPALVVKTRGRGDPLWDAPVPLTDAVDGLPYGVARRARAGTSASSCCSAGGRRHGRPLIAARTGSSGTNADGSPISRTSHAGASTCERGDGQGARQAWTCRVGLTDFGDVHAADRQERPGAGPRLDRVRVLIAGITITFYRPRRRVWARLAAGRPARASSGGPTATSTSSASSAGSSTSWSRSGVLQSRLAMTGAPRWRSRAGTTR